MATAQSSVTHNLHFNPSQRKPLLKSQPTASSAPSSLAPVLGHKKKHTHPTGLSGDENASITFIGNATTVLEWEGLRILTDPNFLHAGDHLHLGPGVTAKRLHDPAVDLHQLPPLDAILLSHYHADHFDQLVEDSLNRDFTIISTPHAKECLAGKEEPFTGVVDLDFWKSAMIHVGGEKTGEGKARQPRVKITGMPGKHVPPGPLAVVNDLLGAVPPTNGWMIELGYEESSIADPPAGEAAALGGPVAGTGEGSKELKTGYRIYISGDTLFVDELKDIPKWLKDEKVDLMLVHLGGTTIMGPKLPLIMVTMDGKQGLQLMRLMDPDVTIPIHFDDYDVMLKGLDDFKENVNGTEFEKKVVYLDRGEQYLFKVRE
jgi:L-ascorbate metabolism protein UlaG (beta-lactamase superfamily)